MGSTTPAAFTTVIIGLACVGAAAWTLFFWSGQQVLKIFLGVSVLVHAVVFAVPFTAIRPLTDEPDESMHVIPFTIVQGVEEPTVAVEALTGIEVPDEPVEIPESPMAETSETAASADATAAVETEQAPTDVVDAELPVIERTEWFDFESHPDAASYRKELQRTIQRYFEVPTELDERGYEGRIKVWLNLGRDGRLHYAFIDPVMRSENDAINRLTEANVQRIADRFPPFPEGVTDYDVSFYVIIDYRNLRER